MLAFAGIVGPALTVGFARLHLPMLALLLPVAGAAWSRRREAVRLSRRAGLAAVMGLMTWIVLTGLTPVIEHQIRPSRHYEPLVGVVAEAVGATPVWDSD